LAWQLAAYNALYVIGHCGQSVKINACLIAAFVQQIDQVLGADISGGAWGERATA
jgi:hypothetical protein